MNSMFLSILKKPLIFLDKYKERINNFLSIFFLTYFILVFLPYVVADIPVLNSFFMGAVTKLVFRTFTTIYLCLYGIILGYINRQGVKWPFIVGGSVLIICYLASILLAPKYYSYVLLGLSNRVEMYDFYIGTYSYITYGFSFLADVVSFVVFISYIPYSMKNIKQLYPTLIFLISFMFIACFYSLIKERIEIIQLLKGGSEYNITVRSFFHSKNAFGLYLFVGALSSAFVFLTMKSKWRWIFPLSLIVFTGMPFLAMCKSALMCCLILDLFVIWILVFSSKGVIFYISILLGIISILVIVAFIIVISTPSLREGRFSDIYNLFTKIIKGIFTRTDRWDMVKYVVYDEFIFIGMNESNSTFFLEIMSKISQNIDVLDFHNAYVTWYAHHGIIGCIIYGLLIVYIVSRIIKLWKIDKKFMLLLLSLFTVCLLFMAPESYILFVSISSYSFIINIILLCSFDLKRLPLVVEEVQSENI